jgi:hypothetical protein
VDSDGQRLLWEELDDVGRPVQVVPHPNALVRAARDGQRLARAYVQPCDPLRVEGLERRGREGLRTLTGTAFPPNLGLLWAAAEAKKVMVWKEIRETSSEGMLEGAALSYNALHKRAPEEKAPLSRLDFRLYACTLDFALRSRSGVWKKVP